MEAKEMYQKIFCENCGKCNGSNIEIVENKQDKLKIIRCNTMGQKINEYNK